MTRQEFTNERSLEFSRWIRKYLPDSMTGFCVGNLDWILWNWKKKVLMIVEEKTHLGKVNVWHDRLMKEVFCPALQDFCIKNNIEFKGYHVIKFENTSPEDGKIYLDGIEIDKDILISLFGF